MNGPISLLVDPNRWRSGLVPPIPTRKVDLSPLKVLRSLEVGDWLTPLGVRSTRHATIIDAFSTITSPAFSEFVIVLQYAQRDLLLSDGTLFETLRFMNDIRSFKLVFLLQLPHSPSVEKQQAFKRNVELVTAKGLLDFLACPPITRVEIP